MSPMEIKGRIDSRRDVNHVEITTTEDGGMVAVVVTVDERTDIPVMVLSKRNPNERVEVPGGSIEFRYVPPTG